MVQRQFWLLHQLAPASPAYHIAQAFRLRGRLEAAALEQSLRQIVACHDVFRTSFTVEGEQLLQVVGASTVWDVSTLDLRGHRATAREAAVRRLLAAEAVRPFDLRQGPLLRVLRLQLGDEDHVLLFTLHHSITDLQALQQFFRELGLRYEAAVTGGSCSLPPPAAQYADYARWEQGWRGTPEYAAMLSYWQQQLGGQDRVLTLPTDRPRPAVPSWGGSQEPVVLSEEVVTALRRWGREAGVPLFVTLLTAYGVLLHRYSRQTPVVVGVPFTNRRQERFREVLGCFINILPVVLDFSGSPSFRAAAQQVRQTLLEAHRRQEVTLERMVEGLRLSRDLSHNPLYQVGFTFRPPAVLTLPGLVVEPLAVETGTSQLDLFLMLWEEGSGMGGRLEYGTDLFEADTMARLVGHYGTLLSSIAEDPERPIGSLALLSPAQQRQLLVQWNDTQVDYPRDRCLHQWFEGQAARTPEAVAVVFEQQQLTYRQLNERANQLAHHLRSLGVGPEVPVGVYLERSLEMLVGLYGILKAGGAYLPVDPEFPKERIAYMLEHSQVPVLLTQERLKEQLGRPAATLICLDSDWRALSGQHEQNLPNVSRPEHLAYVIYTSGSTGKPKGVQVPHGAVVNFLASMQREPGLTAHDVLLTVTTLSFDISVLELFLPLMVGARTVIVSREVSSDGGRLLEALERHHVTVMQATPATWRLMIAAGWEGSGRLKVLCGGEALPKDLARDLLRRAGSVWNLYGPTETTVWSTCCRLTDPEGPILIGQPIANTQVYILDPLLQPVPIGVPGEIYIGGAGVARGYLKAPDLTAERFIASPLTRDPEVRLYKTGDFGRYRHDGNIEFLGRGDHQVKVRGFRIELGEIETVLGKHAQVHEAAVALRTDALGHARLVAYVVPATEEGPAVESLRQFLQERLPYYMVPELYVILVGLPLTPNGKVDRQALPEPGSARPALEQAYVAPATDQEKALSRIWGQVLGLDRVGVHDNFFDLGGNSLLGVQVIGHVRERLDVVLPVIKLFQCPTIASLAKCLGGDDSAAVSTEQIERRAQRRRAVLCSRKSLPDQPSGTIGDPWRGLS
jgi:amino acid adenylation domain-containing protein